MHLPVHLNQDRRSAQQLYAWQIKWTSQKPFITPTSRNQTASTASVGLRYNPTMKSMAISLSKESALNSYIYTCNLANQVNLYIFIDFSISVVSWRDSLHRALDSS